MSGNHLLNRLRKARSQLTPACPTRAFGQLMGTSGLAVEVGGLSGWLSVGDRLFITSRLGHGTCGEVVSFRNGKASVLPFSTLLGLGPGNPAIMEPRWSESSFTTTSNGLPVSDNWLGRIMDPSGIPLDGKPPPQSGMQLRATHAQPPKATERSRLGSNVDLGVGVLNLFVPIRHGQRLGLFAGSGVGKSTLLAMLARYTECDVTVVVLVGERGREVREFIEDELGNEGLAKAVVVVATSDMPPLSRREAAYSGLAIAEYFRDQGKTVLLLMDSVTRYCAALREIALSSGEPPAARGFPPSVFAELPSLLERAGPGPERSGQTGQITALFTVLVDGDDHNDPIADAIRGLLDGHIKLDRRIAESGRYPAVDILGSLSRTASSCYNYRQAEIVKQARALLSLWRDMGEMVRLGVYRAGSDPTLDHAITIIPRLETVLSQDKNKQVTAQRSFEELEKLLNNDG